MAIVNEEDRISLLQDSLKIIRQLCKWRLEDFGQRIGVTKQTMSRLERKSVVMSRTMYIAIRAVLEEELAENDNDILRRAIPLLLREGSEGEKLTDTEYAEIKKAIEAVAVASSGNADMGTLRSILTGAISAIPSVGVMASASYLAMPAILGVGAVAGTGAAMVAGMGAFSWLRRLLKNDSDNKNTAETN